MSKERLADPVKEKEEDAGNTLYALPYVPTCGGRESGVDPAVHVQFWLTPHLLWLITPARTEPGLLLCTEEIIMHLAHSVVVKIEWLIAF